MFAVVQRFPTLSPRMSFIKAIGQGLLGTGIDKPEFKLVEKEDVSIRVTAEVNHLHHEYTPI